jgi:uncharacterized protein (DUF2267 family)
MKEIIRPEAIYRRKHWIKEIELLSGSFRDNTYRLMEKLKSEIMKEGNSVLLDNIRLCGVIPELYSHDSSEEKLYSKYTDMLLCEAFRSIGIKSNVITERGDAADVEAFAKEYSFVADAKAFRLSRTAKNQKDFKVLSMDGWKLDKTYAMVVCPIYQMPTKSSQIYLQASSRNVCLFTYSHLAVTVKFAQLKNCSKAENMLEAVFKSVVLLNPSKDAHAYWFAVNKTMLDFSPLIADIWKDEKQAAVESIKIAKDEALFFLSMEREKIMRMNHDEALEALVKIHKIDAKITTIKSFNNNMLLGIG